jgi:hypothetical protein
MNWILPTPLLLFAGAVALLPLTSMVRRPTSLPRLVVEAFAELGEATRFVPMGCGRR